MCLEFGDFLRNKIKYINIGGGYVFTDRILNAVIGIATKFEMFGITIIMEPSYDISNNAGYLVASVVDTFKAFGDNIAVLDTSVNHLPEYFQYSTRPNIVTDYDYSKSDPEILHPITLAGASCLGGDVFGEYKFSKPLKIKDQVIFKNVGAYSTVMAHRFNGIPLPNLIIKD